MHSFLTHFIIAVTTTVLLTLPAAALSTVTSSTAPAVIDISPLASHMSKLPPDEQAEQLRDWALYGLRSSLGLPTEGEVPIRRRLPQYSATAEIALGRVFAVSTREWGVLVPREGLENSPQIGGLIDRQYATTNSLPEIVTLYGYVYNAAAATLTVTREKAVALAEVYSPAYGYHTGTASTLEDLARFVRQVDDIVQVRLLPDRLELGGRRYRRDERGMLTVEEIAALYQAYNMPLSDGERGTYETFVRKKLAEMTRKDRKLRAALKSGAKSETQVLESIRHRYPPDSVLNRDLNVGFSLDPSRDHQGLAAGLEQYAGELTAYENPHGYRNAPHLATQIEAIRAAARRIGSNNDIKPLFTLMTAYDRSSDSLEREIGLMLHSIEMKHSYQSARYIGNLQGTRAGMILFYTDLLAKLWAFDYEGIAPRQAVAGFRSMLDISVPKLHWDEFRRLNQTRLWFGLRQEGFNLYGDRLLFQPTATRVYAASSNPIAPGKESRPNYQSGEFLGWWDRHYETMAGYEPYYRKLNQIQKWSSIFMILKEKRSRNLDVLRTVHVDRTIDFEAWLKENNPSLASPVKIPFLDRNKFRRSTECLPLLVSKSHELMGKYFVLGGGVTLASRREILVKMFEHDAATLKKQQKVAYEESVSGGSGEPDSGAASSSRPPSPPAQQKAAIDGPERTTGRIPKPPQRKGGEARHVGTFRAEKQQGKIRLNWEKSPAVATDELVGALAELQQTTARGSRGEALFKNIPDIRATVRVKDGESYLVKTVATGDRWIQLSINPAVRDSYPAQASAAFPEADIFCGRTVTDAEARKLAGGAKLPR